MQYSHHLLECTGSAFFPLSVSLEIHGRRNKATEHRIFSISRRFLCACQHLSHALNLPSYPLFTPVDHLKNGFRKDEFKVEVDNSGKLTLRGERSLDDGKFMRLEQVFEVPKDSHINKISGKFEGGCLSLFMPKKVVRETEVPQRAASPEKPRSEEPIQKEKPVAGDKKKEAPIQKDQPESSEREEKEPIQKEKPKDREETKAAAPVYEEKPLTDKNKEDHLIQDEPIRKQKPVSSMVSEDRFEKYKKNGMAWKETTEEEVEGWLDYGLIDGLLETMSRNKKVIAVAVAAFCTGFYVSQKLRSNGR